MDCESTITIPPRSRPRPRPRPRKPGRKSRTRTRTNRLGRTVQQRMLNVECSRPSREKLKLPQKPHVVLVEQPDVVDPIPDHRDAFDAEAEGPAGPDLGIVADVLEHLRVHHPAAGDL